MFCKRLLLVGVIGISAAASAGSDYSVDKRIDHLMGVHSHQQYHRFFNQLKTAVGKHDKPAVAKLINYPITAPIAGKDHVITNAEQFIKLYEQIFTPARQQLVKQQQYSDLFANSSGIMMGKQGEIWFSGICEDTRCQRFAVKIIRFNG